MYDVNKNELKMNLQSMGINVMENRRVNKQLVRGQSGTLRFLSDIFRHDSNDCEVFGRFVVNVALVQLS